MPTSIQVLQALVISAELYKTNLTTFLSPHLPRARTFSSSQVPGDISIHVSLNSFTVMQSIAEYKRRVDILRKTD